jgi:ABC-type glycerol-3-phosphate transport system permease component
MVTAKRSGRVTNQVTQASLADRYLSLARMLVVALVLTGAIAPLFLMAKQAITPELETFAWPPLWLPHRITFAHFADVFRVSELRGSAIRSIVVGLLSSAMATGLGAMLAYAMARNSFARKSGLGALTAVRLLPMIAIAIPLGISLAALGLYDTPSGIGLTIVHAAIALPTAALTLYAAFDAIPFEMEEAAWIDGAGPVRIFVTIALPLARGAIAAAFTLCFILSWDEFGFALLLQQTNRTLPPLLYYYTVFGNVGDASALALLMMIPAICVTIALGPALRGALLAGTSR